MAAAVAVGATPVLYNSKDTATESVMVSATVLSSDLFTPFQDPRVTLPSLGEQQQALQPLGGKSWGGNIADYGGIGGLSHLGIHRVKDLPVSRSHRHYQSGLTKHDQGPQPYVRTQLRLSECRVNDQSLTQPLQSDPQMLHWEAHTPSSWPGFHAYTSHRPRFEVFPTGGDDKPPVTATQSAPGTRKSQPLGEATRSAISEINRRLYQRTSYQDAFPDYTREFPLITAKSIPNRLQKVGVIPLTDSAYGDSIYHPVLTDVTDSTVSEPVLKPEVCKDRPEDETRDDADEDKAVAADGDEEDADNEQNEQAEADAENAGISESPTPSSSPQKSRSTNKSVSFVMTPQIMEDTIRKFDITPNKPMTGVGPNWPPSTSQVINGINGSQLLERNDITEYPPAYRSALKQIETGQQIPRPPTPKKSRKSRPKSVSHDKLKKHDRSIASVKLLKNTKAEAASQTASPPPAPPLPPPLSRQEHATKRSAPLQPLTANQKTLTMLCQLDDYEDGLYRELNDNPKRPFVVPNSYRQSIIRKSTPTSLPALKKTKSKVFNLGANTKRSLALPPAPLSDCLSPAGRRVPHRLGLRYKTEAHKRYHICHPESVPDLRDTRVDSTGKRYFFYDNHSSVFRG